MLGLGESLDFELYKIQLHEKALTKQFVAITAFLWQPQKILFRAQSDALALISQYPVLFLLLFLRIYNLFPG